MSSMQNRAPMLTNNTQTFYTDLGLAFGEDSHEKVLLADYNRYSTERK